jgi:Lambda phage tail tube protein, TTP
MTSATISYFKWYIGTTASPQVLTAIEEVYSVSNVGHTNQLVDVTNFDSPAGTKEYIAGLAEGDEVTVECNYVPGATMQTVAMASVDSGLTKKFKLTYTNSSPNRSWSGTAVCMGYSVAPSPTERNSIRFTFKITGAVTRV